MELEKWHTHPKMEREKGVGEEHVIIDRASYLGLVEVVKREEYLYADQESIEAEHEAQLRTVDEILGRQPITSKKGLARRQRRVQNSN